jgi:hypothetical protein
MDQHENLNIFKANFAIEELLIPFLERYVS